MALSVQCDNSSTDSEIRRLTNTIAFATGFEVVFRVKVVSYANYVFMFEFGDPGDTAEYFGLEANASGEVAFYHRDGSSPGNTKTSFFTGGYTGWFDVYCACDGVGTIYLGWRQAGGAWNDETPHSAGTYAGTMSFGRNPPFPADNNGIHRYGMMKIRNSWGGSGAIARMKAECESRYWVDPTDGIFHNPCIKASTVHHDSTDTENFIGPTGIWNDSSDDPGFDGDVDLDLFMGIGV